jgi:ABC-type uncharacterized transport system YnjBCD ATPase subunit
MVTAAPRVLFTPLAPSPRVLRTCALFGVPLDRAPTTPIHPDHPDHRVPLAAEPPVPAALVAAIARTLDDDLAPFRVCLLQGPSGSGKSSILAALARRVRARGDHVRALAPPAAHAATLPGARALALRPNRALVDQVDAPLKVALDILAAIGIAEPALLVLPPHAVSEGQRHRAHLARALALAARLAIRRRTVVTLLVDEFASPLDPDWAAAIARGVPRAMLRLERFLSTPRAPARANPRSGPRANPRSCPRSTPRPAIRVVLATSRPALYVPGAMRVALPDPLAPRT